MPLPSIRRKSKPAGIARAESTANASFPVGGSSPEGLEPVLTSHAQPRPRSSWYSQGSVSYATSLSDTSPSIPHTMPAQLSTMTPTPLTPTALLSLDEAARWATDEEWQDDELPESPGRTRQHPYMSQNKRTAVSEYLRERAWVPTTPMPSHAPPIPTSTPTPVPGASAFRRSSSTSDTERWLSRRGSRGQSVRSKRSSITTLPYPASAQEHELLLRPPQHAPPQTPNCDTPSTQTPSSKSSNALSFLTPRQKTRTDTSATSPAVSTVAAEALISTPYEQTRRGHSPTPVATLHAFDHQVPSKSSTNASLIRGLSQKYGPRPQQTRPELAHSAPNAQQNNAIPNRFNSVAAANQSQSRSRATVLPSSHTHPCTQTQKTLHSSPSGPRFLNTRTRDPAESSDEGSWLYIGTLRGPTPTGVRMMDEIMGSSLKKKGTTEKGVKEIRKLLRHEGRGTIEWVGGYLRETWGAEL